MRCKCEDSFIGRTLEAEEFSRRKFSVVPSHALFFRPGSSFAKGQDNLHSIMGEILIYRRLSYIMIGKSRSHFVPIFYPRLLPPS